MVLWLWRDDLSYSTVRSHHDRLCLIHRKKILIRILKIIYKIVYSTSSKHPLEWSERILRSKVTDFTDGKGEGTLESLPLAAASSLG